jgi:hypothetical protein
LKSFFNGSYKEATNRVVFLHPRGTFCIVINCEF